MSSYCPNTFTKEGMFNIVYTGICLVTNNSLNLVRDFDDIFRIAWQLYKKHLVKV